MGIDIPAALVFIVVTTFTPGPNNILSGSMGALYGYRRAVPFMLGVASGFLVVMLLCATLSSFLATNLPAVSQALRWLGGLYILWLAYGVYRRSSLLLEGPEKARPLRYWNGLTLQFVNPKAILFGLTVYSAFLAPLLGAWPVLLVITLLMACEVFCALTAWALGGNLVRGWIRTPGRARAVGLVLSLALVYTALDLAGVF